MRRPPPSGAVSPDGSPLPADPSDRRWGLGTAREAVEARLAAWADAGAVGKIWRKDPSFWPEAAPTDVAGRLGWLWAPERSVARVGELGAFAEEVARDGVEHVVLFGMGGSSLAAETIYRVLCRPGGRPDLSVLDSTHPAAVRACLDRAPPDRSLYLVSSKSGTTLEPNAFFRCAWERAGVLRGAAGRHFIAITDPGTPLEGLARERRFRACFTALPDVGGRYSALTVFGLVPAALVGVDLAGLLRPARAMAARCADPVEGLRNPGLRLGAALGELARAGRDKVVFLTSRSLQAFPAWCEQLVAESLGKLGRGIVPVAGTPPTELPRGSDVVLAYLALEGEGDRGLERELDAREAEGTPVLRFELGSPLDLGRELFRWEFATAACGAVLDVNPFDQPDVEHAKELARQAMAPLGTPSAPRDGYGVPVGKDLGASLEAWLGTARTNDYVAVQAFLAPDEATDAALGGVVSRLRHRLGTVVTAGYGPRFLHSTGQLHKGGPASGLFLQLVDEPATDLEVPGLGLSFGGIVRAQAKGDRGALEEKRRRLLVVNVGARPLEGLSAVARLLDRSRRPPMASG